MSTSQKEKLETAEALISAREKLCAKKVMVGFDGMIDEIIHVVATRHNRDNFQRVETIRAFGNRILSAAGKSSNMELVPVMKKFGGNGPIMALAAAGLGPHVTCIGLLGQPSIAPEFRHLAERCQVVSIGDPGHTDALEFSDGKLMMGKLDTIPQMNWNQIKTIMGEDEYARIIRNSDMVAVTNWTMLTEIKEILDHTIEIAPSGKGPVFFFDLADPEKRRVSEVEELFVQMSALSKKCRCILGLNLREAEQIAHILKIKSSPEDGLEGLKKSALSIKRGLGIHGVAIHSVSFAGAAVGSEVESVKGPFCPHPRITTGAGDHFNGGLSSSLMAGLPLKTALYIGVSCSGWYVRNDGSSPQLEDIYGFLKDWAEGRLADMPSHQPACAAPAHAG